MPPRCSKPPVLHRARAAALALLGLAASGCSEDTPIRSIVLLTIDTTRADHLGTYGYSGARTPAFDELAAGGTLYLRAYSPVPETLPAHTSLLTGLYPPSHGVRLNLSFRLPAEAVTLAELLRARGLRTAAVVAAGVLDARYGLDQGFETYEDPPLADGLREWPGEEITRRALAASERFGSEPFFLWAHYYDPHSPYEPRPPFAAPPTAGPESIELYDREIAYTDSQVGALLAGLERRGQIADAAVILTADHGESLGEHGETYHTIFVYEATQRVPLIVRGPGVPAGQRVEQPVASVDLFATALALLGAEPAPPTSSRLLPGLGLGAGAGAGGDGIFSESMAPPLRFGWAGLQALRSRGWLYVSAPSEELYDLAADPAAQVNLAPREPEQLGEMRGELRRALAAMPAADWVVDATPRLGAEERAALETLGYVEAGAAGQADADAGEDPKDMVEVSEAFQLARLARRRDRPETAERLLRFVVAVDPENFGGWLQLGHLLLGEGRTAESATALERALELSPAQWRTLLLLAVAQRQLGSPGAAERHLYEALRLTTFPAEVWRELARLRVSLEDWEGAALAYRRVLEFEPRDQRAAAALQELGARGFLDPASAPGAEAAGPDADAGSG